MRARLDTCSKSPRDRLAIYTERMITVSSTQVLRAIMYRIAMTGREKELPDTRKARSEATIVEYRRLKKRLSVCCALTLLQCSSKTLPCMKTVCVRRRQRPDYGTVAAHRFQDNLPLTFR